MSEIDIFITGSCSFDAGSLMVKSQIEIFSTASIHFDAGSHVATSELEIFFHRKCYLMQEAMCVCVCVCVSVHVCVCCVCCVGGCASVHMAQILHMFALNTINCKMFMLYMYIPYNTFHYSTMSSFGQLCIHHFHLNYLQ